MSKFKSKKVLKAIAYGLNYDAFCENDYSICRNTANRRFKKQTFINVLRIDHELKTEWRKHQFIDN